MCNVLFSHSVFLGLAAGAAIAAACVSCQAGYYSEITGQNIRLAMLASIAEQGEGGSARRSITLEPEPEWFQ